MRLSDYLTLGHSGLRVSPLCLGTMTFGSDEAWTCDGATAERMIGDFVDRGGNFIDTANNYTGGESERIVGRALKASGQRNQLVVATKYTFDAGEPGVNATGNGRKNAWMALDASLGRLGMDHVDLYWMHAWDQVTPIEEVVQTFDAMVRSGKIRYYGLSDVPAWYAARVCDFAERHGLARPIALQLEYSLVERIIEQEHLPAARALGLGVCPWSPLAGGVLTGKYRRGEGGTGRLAGPSPFAGLLEQERIWPIVAALDDAARAIGAPPTHVALRWLLSRYPSMSIILGATRPEQLVENLAALELELPCEALRTLDRASQLRSAMPYALFRPGFRDRLLRAVRGWDGI